MGLWKHTMNSKQKSEKEHSGNFQPSFSTCTLYTMLTSLILFAQTV